MNLEQLIYIMHRARYSFQSIEITCTHSMNPFVASVIADAYGHSGTIDEAGLVRDGIRHAMQTHDTALSDRRTRYAAWDKQARLWKSIQGHLRDIPDRPYVPTYAQAIDRYLRYEQIIDSSFLLTSHQLDILEPAEWLGREATLVRAVFTRYDEMIFEPSAWRVAHDHYLVIDNQYGTLLHQEARLDDMPFLIRSVTAVTYDMPIDTARFQ